MDETFSELVKLRQAETDEQTDRWTEKYAGRWSDRQAGHAERTGLL